ncbi:hypothetical protein EHJ13_06180 [Cronobacter dublinensis]|uniref:Uncharacterized protein n=1 Tax=Cronobacter dublinensis TaxID=413497 RepID=A0A9Q4T589_9ENTR|nr:hypothetical protein [Cronobacter dublinensis]NCH87037.1 hypothetical protein [Cronobacter dublinensis]
MAIDAETFRWCVTGFFTGMAVVSGVAYHDPKFFQSWVFGKLAVASLCLYIIVCSFWLGAKSVKEYVINKLFVPKEQLAEFIKVYEGGTDVMQWLLIGATIAFFWAMLLHSLSAARLKNKSP